ncbi:mannonate dehydratase [Aquabacter sp. CN5-332]|uniref:mannonate dehydratase n=1 Tax=Aquabacter sp. CN5-332 TaxID=3156608 RepID=UPI0032B4FA6C
MIQAWRWFGPSDPVTLRHIRQAGAKGVVTALHHKYGGEPWTLDDVRAHKALIEQEGLEWSVCESIPVMTDVKVGGPGAKQAIENWKTSLRSLAGAGIPVVCFNFMPVVDWTRTDLEYEMPSTGLALRFDMIDFVAYDVCVLRGETAAGSYDPKIVEKARQRHAGWTAEDIRVVEDNIICGLPGGEGRYDRQSILRELELYRGVTPEKLRANLVAFLREVVPVAEEVGVKLVIHPDDPPFSLFGLPRVVSTAEDIRHLLGAVDSPANGIVICTGSYGARADNDLVAMVREFGPRINFVHLRNVRREDDGSFHESDHLDGSVDMVAVIQALMDEEAKRKAAGRQDWQIPMRPDHGHVLVDDIGKKVNPGYSCIGRLKGLAELRGVMVALAHKDTARASV